jgi:hypothetical protein
MLLLFAILFATFHLAGWSYMFLLPVQAMLWRTSSVAITVAPCIILVMVFWNPDQDSILESGLRASPTLKICTDIVAFGAFVFIAVYVVDRTASLVEASVALRDLRPGAFVVVRWMSHI